MALVGTVVNCREGEYSEIDGLENGSKVKLVIDATVNKAENGSVDVSFDGVEFETENQADVSLKAQTKQSYQPQMSGKSGKGTGDDF